MVKSKIGRWVYCKYCSKNTKPILGGIFQVLCGECEYGLTPDFFSEKGLMEWLKSGDYDKCNNLKEEKLAREKVVEAMKKGISRESSVKTGRLVIEDMHTPQLELRQVSKEAIYGKI